MKLKLTQLERITFLCITTMSFLFKVIAMLFLEHCGKYNADKNLFIIIHLNCSAFNKT